MITTQEAIEMIKMDLHNNETDFESYNNYNVRINTNCYAYAIGATLEYSEVYRLGVFSGKKMDIEEPYSSEKEMKYLLESDLDSLEIQYENIEGKDEEELKNEVSKIDLHSNQHVIVLFGNHYANGLLKDFHFLRYDKNRGWTDKRWGIMPQLISDWPYSLYYNVIAAYIITVKECIN